MLETSVFLLRFSYIKACQCYRFFNVTKQQQKNPSFGCPAFDEALHKNAKQLTKEAPRTPGITSGFPHGEKSLHPFPSQPHRGSPISLASIFYPKSDYMLQIGIILAKESVG